MIGIANYRYCKQFKSTFIKSLKILFFIGAIAFISFNLPEILSHLKTISYSTVAGLILLQLITLLVIAYQWKLCDKVLESKPSQKQSTIHNQLKVSDFWILNSYGKIFEGITPGVKSGGEGLKTVMLVNKYNYPKKDALILVLIQKSVSLVSFVVLLVALCVILPTQASNNLINYANMLHILTITITVLILLALIINFWGKKKDSKYFLKLQQLTAILRKKKLFVFLAFLLGLVNWTLLGCSTLLISQNLGLDLSVIQASSATFMGYLFGMIPVSPGGIGTYEGAMTLQFYNSNVSQSSALSLSILSRVFTFWTAILISFLSITLIKITYIFQWLNYLPHSRKSRFNHGLASLQNKLR